jgi:hypothetical protein
MVCYVVPTIGALALYVFRTVKTGWHGNTYVYWLNILLLGGALFGLVDHAWNNELFFLGENVILDIALGITITLAIIIVWTLIVVFDKVKTGEPKKITH